MKKTIVITGATGFVGKKLTLALTRKGYDVRVVTREITKAKEILPLPITYFGWDGSSRFPEDALINAHAVIHLAGENIASGRWSAAKKTAIMNSRIQGTKSLVEAIARIQNPPQILIGTSAIGIYGDTPKDILTETSPRGDGFLADVCSKWENSYETFNGRLAILRVGVVLGHGGALDKMLLLFRLGLGGKLASGKQWMSWIHIDDLVNMYIHCLESDSVSGIYNAVATTSISNTEFTKSMGRALKRPVLFPVPGQFIKLIFGEMSQVIIGSQRVTNKKILETGFSFIHPAIESALNHLLVPGGHAGTHVVEFFQWVAKPRSEVFNFFSRAENLEKITPQWLNFHIKKKSSPDISEGCLIDYRLKIKGIPVSWQTLISTWRPMERFVDEQLKGPYSIWHHTHDFEDLKDGTLIIDRVIYRAPLGPIGSVIEFLMIRHDIRKIFGHRKLIISKSKFIS